MTLRPKNLFLTLALMIAGQAFDAKAETAEERLASAVSRTGLDTDAVSAAGILQNLQQSTVQVNSDSARPASADTQVVVESTTPHPDRPSPGSTGGASVRCNLQGSPLSPELERLVAGFCPPENAGQAEYCDCVVGYINGNNMGPMAQARKEDMLRIGYQFYLEDWAKRYQANILAFRRQAENSFLASMPPQCKPSELMTRVMQNISDVNSCRGDRDAFRKAFNKILRFDGIRGADVSQLGSPTDQEWLGLIDRKAYFNRFYVSPDHESNTSASQDFIDCMSPSDKRAYALIPVKWGNDDSQVELRKANFTKITTAISLIHDSADPLLALSQSPEKEKIRGVFEIFPGMEDLFNHGQLSKDEAREVISSLQKFLRDIQHPDFKRLGEAKASKDLMDRMSASVKSVKDMVKIKLGNPDTIKSLVPQLSRECDKLSEDLGKIACDPEDFAYSPDFMNVAFSDASSKGMSDYAGVNPPSFLMCSDRDRLGNAQPVELANCMGYHAAQCETGREHQGRGGNSIPPFNSMKNLDLQNRASIEQMISDQNAAQSLLVAEKGVVHTMCGGFNDYLRETGCNATELPKYDNDFRACAASRGQFDKYLATKPNDPWATRMPSPYDEGSVSSPPDNSSSERKNLVSNNDDTFLAEAETVAETVSVDNTSSTSRYSPTGISTTPPGSSAVTVPLDIDTPAEIRAAIEQREQKVESKTAEIAQLDEKIAELGTDNESARLSAELASLRAEMVAERERNNREIAELRNRASAPETATVADKSADEDGPAPVGRRAEVRGSGNGIGGAGNAQAEGFNIGRAPASASDNSNNGDFTKASVSTNFGAAGATRGGLIQAAQSLPAVQSQDPNARLSLRVGDASYPVSDVQSIPLLPGKQLSRPEDIAFVIGEQNKLDKIPVDAENRAFVEIREPVAPFNSIVVYVRITESGIEFLDAKLPQAEESGVRATLIQLESLLGAVRD